MYNYILVCAILSWLIAQILKTIIDGIKKNKVSVERLVGAGGMPSSHTSTVISALIAVGRTEGVKSTFFAIMFILSAIVIYDAMGVRRAAGMHAKELNKINNIFSELTKKDKSIVKNKAQYEFKLLKEFLGHTPLEVFGGAIVGVIIAFAVPMK